MSKYFFWLGLLLPIASCSLALVDVSLDGAAAADNNKDKNGGGPRDGKLLQRQEEGNMPPIPAEVEKALPPETVAQVKAIITDRTLTPPQIQERVDRVLLALPDAVLDRIPKPPGFDQLPAPLVTQLKTIARNRSKSWAERQQELQAFVHKLPFDQQAVVRMGLGLAPPPPNFKRNQMPFGAGGMPMPPQMPGGGAGERGGMPGGMGGMPQMPGSSPGGGMPAGMPMPGMPPRMG